MRRTIVMALLFELALLAAAASVEDGVDSTAVFEMGSLVDEAEQFAKGAQPKTAAQTALQRVEAMKKALTQKILNKEIDKLPYTHTELGEGMAVETLKDKASESYNQFKEMAKVIEAQKAEVQKKLTKAEAAKVSTEKREAKARKDAAELRGKLRKSVSKQAPNGQAQLVDKLQDKVKTLKESVQEHKAVAKDEKKRAKQEIKKIRDYFDDAMKQNKADLTKQREDDASHLHTFRETLKTKWYSNTTKLLKMRRGLTRAHNKIRDLEQSVKDADKRYHEMERGLRAKFRAKEGEIISKEEEKLAKAGSQTAGEQQKEAWDKEKVFEAKKEAKEENKEMAKAVSANEGLQDLAASAQSKLSGIKKREAAELEEAEKKESDLELKGDLEKVKSDQAKTKVDSVKAEQKMKSQELSKDAQDAVEEAKSAASRKVAEMQRKVEAMQEKFQNAEKLGEADEKEKVAEAQASADKEVDKMDEKRKETQNEEKLAESKANDAKEKLGLMKEELERKDATIKELKETQNKEEDRFKEMAKDDASRIRKRQGARTEAQAEKQEVQSVDIKLAQKEQALQGAMTRANQLSKQNDGLQKQLEKFKNKAERSEYKVSLEKQKAAKAAMNLEKEKIATAAIRRTAKHDQELGEAKNAKDGRMEVKYKYEVKAAEALKQQIAVEQSKGAVSFARNQKWEAKAQKYKQAMYAAEAHARRIAGRVRKKWAMKMIKEQDTHTKSLMKLKHLIAVRQAKHDATILRIRAQRDSAKVSASKAKGAAGNQEEITKYIAGLVNEQAVRGRVLRDYMFKMDKIRQKYNKKLGTEWTTEIKRLRKELKRYKNGREIAGYKYKIMKLKAKMKDMKKQKSIKMEVKRSQELDIQTLLGAAIKEASKGSRARSEEENRKRVDTAVAAVVKSVKAADSQKGKDLADHALAKELDAESSTSKDPATMTKTIAALQEENRKLRAKLQVSGEQHQDTADADAGSVNHKIGKHMTPKQKKLLGKLGKLIKLSELPQSNNKITTDVARVYEPEVPKPPSKDAKRKVGDNDVTKPSTNEYSAGSLGELRKDALLVPAERTAEMDRNR